MVEIFIENIIASATISGELDLQQIIDKLPNCEYNPGQFSGVIYKPEKPRVVMLLFNNGKIMVTAAKSIQDVENSITMVEKQLSDAGLLNPIDQKPKKPTEEELKPEEKAEGEPEKEKEEEPKPEGEAEGELEKEKEEEAKPEEEAEKEPEMEKEEEAKPEEEAGKEPEKEKEVEAEAEEKPNKKEKEEGEEKSGKKK